MRSYRKRSVDHMISFNISWYGLKRWFGDKAVAVADKRWSLAPKTPYVFQVGLVACLHSSLEGRDRDSLDPILTNSGFD